MKWLQVIPISKEQVSASLVSVPCPVCGSEERINIYPGTIRQDRQQSGFRFSYDISLDGHHPVVRCSNCGLYYVCPRDSGDILNHAYAGGSVHSYLKEADGKLISFRREALLLRNFCGNGTKLLEIGCATGLFLRAANELGFDVFGCDPWVEAATIAEKEFGNRIKIGMFDAANYTAENFGSIVLWDVFEHVEDPAKLARELFTLLIPDGWLVLSIPNFDSWSRRILGSHWHFFERPHIVFFDPRTISDLLRTVGFFDVRFSRQWKSYSASYYAGYLAKLTPMLSKILLKVIKITKLRKDLMITLPTGCMVVYARKPV